MKRISAIAVTAATVAILIMGAAPALARSGPTTTEVAKAGQYESIVNCPRWVGAMGRLQPLLTAPYAPKVPYKSAAGGALPYDPLVTCTVTFLQKEDPPAPNPLFSVVPGLTVGPQAAAMARACEREHSMRSGSHACCASSRTGKRMSMYSCCAPTGAAHGRIMFACCTTPRSGHGHLYACCVQLRQVAAFMPACYVLNTGYGGMAAQVARHLPVARAHRRWRASETG